MKFLLAVMTLSFSLYGFAFSEGQGEVGQKLGNNLNTCVGCALRAAQIDQENRKAGKQVEEERAKTEKKNSGVRSY
jgi:hypothetical protein